MFVWVYIGLPAWRHCMWVTKSCQTCRVMTPPCTLHVNVLLRVEFSSKENFDDKNELLYIMYYWPIRFMNIQHVQKTLRCGTFKELWKGWSSVWFTSPLSWSSRSMRQWHNTILSSHCYGLLICWYLRRCHLNGYLWFDLLQCLEIIGIEDVEILVLGVEDFWGCYVLSIWQY